MYKGQNHPISEPSSSCDRVINTLLWLNTHCQQLILKEESNPK